MLPIASSFAYTLTGTTLAAGTTPVETRALIDELSDPRTTSEVIADRFREAFVGGSQAALNETIRTVVSQTGAFSFDARVNQLLHEEGIELEQAEDGTVQMRHRLYTVQLAGRNAVIDTALSGILPTSITALIACYDEQVEFSIRNSEALKAAFRSRDPVLKQKIIQDGLLQNQSAFLNEIIFIERSYTETLDMKHITLRGFDLTALRISHANLDGAILSNTNLSCMDLRDIQLVNAVLVNSDLHQSRLTCVNFDHTDLTGANFSVCCLTASHFAGCKMIGAKLMLAVMQGISISKVRLTGASLMRANLSGAFINESSCCGTNFTNAILIKAIVCSTDFSGAIFAGANLTEANFVDTDMTGVDLTGANLSNALLTDTNLTGANLKGANLAGANLTGSNLTDADLTGANLTDAVLDGATLTGAKLPGL